MKLKRWHKIMIAVVAVLFAAKVWLLELAADAEGRYAIDLAALHRAASASGPLPLAIEVEQIAEFAFPRGLVVAGDRFFSMHVMVLLAHRVVWPDRSLIIDTAVGPAVKRQIPGIKIDRSAHQRMLRAMGQAQHIVFTHEHLDHVGGVSSAPDFAAIAGKVAITREQLAGPSLERSEFAPGTLAQLKPLAYTGLHAIAPGVVLQQAPGHSTGTQLIYVELQSGARYLFVGDIAWTEDNIRLQRGRPRLAALIVGEDRAAVAAQVRTIGALPKDVHVVVAHDPVALRRDLAAGLFRRGFSGAQ